MKGFVILCAICGLLAGKLTASPTGDVSVIRDAKGQVVAYVEKTSTGTVTRDVSGKVIGESNDPTIATRHQAAVIAEQQKKEDEEFRRNLSPKTEAKRKAKLEALQKSASRNLMMADSEGQLQAAMAAKMFAQRGNKPLTPAEFQCLDERSKIALILYYPEMIPAGILDTE